MITAKPNRQLAQRCKPCGNLDSAVNINNLDYNMDIKLTTINTDFITTVTISRIPSSRRTH